jgi:CTP synthase
VPYIAAAGEVKTKPTQHSVRELMEIGIQPDFLICRSEKPLQDDVKRKIALFCNVDFGAVIESPDVPTIYEIPLSFEQQGFAERVMERLRLTAPTPDLSRWRTMVQHITNPRERVKICVVGKYTDYIDSYKSVQEALIHGGIANDVGVDLAWTSSDLFTSPERAREILAGYHGLLVPGGFGVRGVDGMVEAIRAARELSIPFFGICLGMQVAIIEFARHVMGLGGLAARRHRHGRHDASWCISVPLAAWVEGRRGVWAAGGERAASSPVRGLEPVSRCLDRTRHAAQRPVPGRLAGGND